MVISKTWTRLSILSATLMAIVGAAGVFLPSVYAQENANWAAQGMGQDLVNLVIIFPAILISQHFVNKGSNKALLVWLGILIYMAYSYVLYAFFMHFGNWFLVYVAILGISFYTLIGSLLEITKNNISEKISSENYKGPAIYLIVNAILFYLLWFMEIIPATINGQVPLSATEVGYWLNPVHVLDLAFILPAMLIAGINLLKKKTTGFLMTVPVIVFAISMGTAILSMIIMQNIRGIIDSIGVSPLMALNILLGIYFTYSFFRGLKNQHE